MAPRCYLTIVELSRLPFRISYTDPPLLGISGPGAKLVGKSESSLSSIRTHVAKSTLLSTCHPRKPCHIVSYPDRGDSVAAVAPCPCSRSEPMWASIRGGTAPWEAGRASEHDTVTHTAAQCGDGHSARLPALHSP